MRRTRRRARRNPSPIRRAVRHITKPKPGSMVDHVRRVATGTIVTQLIQRALFRI